MKRKLLSRMMLLLFALMAGSSSVWANPGDEIKSPNDVVSGKKYYIKGVYTYSGTEYSQYYAPTSDAKDTKVTEAAATDIANAMPILFTYNSTEGKWTLQTPNGFYVRPHTSNGQTYLVEDAVYMTLAAGTTKEGANKGIKIGPYTSGTNNWYLQANQTTAKIGAYKNTQWDVTLIEVGDAESSAVSFAETTPSISFPATTTYTQAATTASGYTGTVTYEITSNTAGATLSGTTVTVTQEGTVTVKATAPAVTGFAKSEASYTLTVNDTRSENELAFAESEQEVSVGEVLTAPILTNPNNLTVTYSSEDETIATVDASGNVTGVAIGTTNIIATFDGNETYKPGSKSYSLTVNFAIKDGVFDFTQNVDYGSNLNQSGVKVQTSTWTAGNVTMYMAGRNCWFDVTDGSDNIRLYKANGGDAAGSITLSVPTSYFISKIDFTGATLNKMSAAEGTYTKASDNKSATWTGCTNSIKFTASDRTDITTITVTYAQGPATLTKNVTSAGWATYAPEYPVSFAAEEAYIIEVADDTETVLTEVSSVPAGTPVLLKGAGDHTLTVVGTSSTDVSDNCLKVSDGTAKDDIYVLADGKYGVGFYLWTGNEALSAGKIYMEPNAVGSSRAFFSLPGESTGISTIDHSSLNVDNSVYNLNGQRVDSPKKGLYIVNGKKMILK